MPAWRRMEAVTARGGYRSPASAKNAPPRAGGPAPPAWLKLAWHLLVTLDSFGDFYRWRHAPNSLRLLPLLPRLLLLSTAKTSVAANSSRPLERDVCFSRRHRSSANFLL